MKKKLPWECANNWMPDWTEELSTALSSCMSDEDHNRITGMLDRYNELVDKEEKTTDYFFIYGMEHEKEELIQDIIKLLEKYKTQAEEINKKWRDLNHE